MLYTIIDIYTKQTISIFNLATEVLIFETYYFIYYLRIFVCVLE